MGCMQTSGASSLPGAVRVFRVSTQSMVAVAAFAAAGPLAACSLAHLGSDPAHEQRYASRAGTTGADSSRDDTIIVQIRGFDRSAVVSVLAWAVDDPEYGLRGDVSRNGGRLLGQPTWGHHEL